MSERESQTVDLADLPPDLRQRIEAHEQRAAKLAERQAFTARLRDPVTRAEAIAEYKGKLAQARAARKAVL